MPVVCPGSPSLSIWRAPQTLCDFENRSKPEGAASGPAKTSAALAHISLVKFCLRASASISEHEDRHCPPKGERASAFVPTTYAGRRAQSCLKSRHREYLRDPTSTPNPRPLHLLYPTTYLLTPPWIHRSWRMETPKMSDRGKPKLKNKKIRNWVRTNPLTHSSPRLQTPSTSLTSRIRHELVYDALPGLEQGVVLVVEGIVGVHRVWDL